MIGSAILNLLGGDPSQQIGAALNPNPLAPPGSAAASGQGLPQPPQQGMAQPQATQSPPDLATLYTKLYDRDQAAHSIDQGTALMASAFGTAQQQHDMMNFAQNIPTQNHMGVAVQALEDQKNLTAQQEHSRFMAGSAMMSKILNTDEPTAQWLMNNPTALNEVLKTHLDATAPTDAMKTANAAADAWATANPGKTPQEVQEYRAGLLGGLATGGDATTKEMMQANRTWDADPNNKDKPKPSYLTDPAQYKAYAAQYIEDQKDVGNAKNSFGANMAKLDPVQKNIEWLQAHPDATAAAIHHPYLAGGATGYYTGGVLAGGQDALTARQKLDQLNAQLYSTSFTGGGAANQRLAAVEAARLGAAFDPFKGDNAANMSDADIANGLKTLKGTLDSAVANTKASAGHSVTEEEASSPYFNSAFTDPYSTLHSGATVIKSDKKSQPSSGGGKTYTYNPKTGQLE